jgi:hypothetical protein
MTWTFSDKFATVYVLPLINNVFDDLMHTSYF